MNSPEHRANILDPRFDSTGVGVAREGDQAVATEIFHGPVPKRHSQNP